MAAFPYQNAAVIAVGSNIEPERNILRAAQLLKEEGQLLATSTFYQTQPLGRPDQPLFINGVWLLGTNRSPLEIKQTLLSDIESRLGRIRTKDKYAARTIDLDLVLYNDIHCQTVGLQLPHPDLARDFVRQPLGEILSAHPCLPYENHWRKLLVSFNDEGSCGIPLTEFTECLQQWMSPP